MNDDAKERYATAVPSASVVVGRDGPGGPEVLMVKRRAGDAFGDSYAFPGGLVDDDDAVAASLGTGLSASEANRVLGLERGGIDYFVAAARELFEETGLLLARHTDGSTPGTLPDLAATRAAVDEGKLDWADFLRDRHLVMCLDELHYFAHWETPLDAPKRWTTRFFVARLPEGQTASDDSHELTAIVWTGVGRALAEARAGRMKMPFPTRRTLEWLSGPQRLDSLIALAGERRAAGISKDRPMQVEYEGKMRHVIPGDPGYPAGGDGVED